MKKLLERINREMEREAKRKGVFFPGNKNITIELELNDNEMCKFHGLNLGNNYHFGIKRNTVIITYIAPDEVFNSLSKLKGKEITLRDLSNKIQDIVDYDILDHNPESELIENSCVSVTSNDQDYEIIFKTIEVDNDNLLNSYLEVLGIEYI